MHEPRSVNKESLGAVLNTGGNCGPDKVEWRAIRAESVEAALAGRPLNVDSLVAALEQLPNDIEPGNTPGASCLS